MIDGGPGQPENEIHGQSRIEQFVVYNLLAENEFEYGDRDIEPEQDIGDMLQNGRCLMAVKIMDPSKNDDQQCQRRTYQQWPLCGGNGKNAGQYTDHEKQVQ
ncbi:hypothetical protein [Thiolapillus sp.]|uniref:hypothetical protein n=1 Tax=Thiolapillus sp. TaxID=2017437 RepID=UPI003AF871BD